MLHKMEDVWLRRLGGGRGAGMKLYFAEQFRTPEVLHEVERSLLIYEFAVHNGRAIHLAFSVAGGRVGQDARLVE